MINPIQKKIIKETKNQNKKFYLMNNNKENHK